MAVPRELADRAQSPTCILWRAVRVRLTAPLETVAHDGRLAVAGPPVEVDARAALSFTLVLHELATNAIKYGALSVPEGRVDVRWDVKPSDTSQTLCFTWNERDGPVSPPTRKGFGTRLIDTMGRTFGGRSELRYDPAGVGWLVEAEAERLMVA